MSSLSRTYKLNSEYILKQKIILLCSKNDHADGHPALWLYLSYIIFYQLFEKLDFK